MCEGHTKTLGAIRDFVGDLHAAYPQDRPLSLYKRLLDRKDHRANPETAERHVSIFKKFCLANRDALTRDTAPESADANPIEFTKRIYVDVGRYLRTSVADTVWSHLKTIDGMIRAEEDDSVAIDNILSGPEFKGILKKVLESEEYQNSYQNAMNGVFDMTEVMSVITKTIFEK